MRTDSGTSRMFDCCMLNPRASPWHSSSACSPSRSKSAGVGTGSVFGAVLRRFASGLLFRRFVGVLESGRARVTYSTITFTGEEPPEGRSQGDAARENRRGVPRFDASLPRNCAEELPYSADGVYGAGVAAGRRLDERAAMLWEGST